VFNGSKSTTTSHFEASTNVGYSDELDFLYDGELEYYKEMEKSWQGSWGFDES